MEVENFDELNQALDAKADIIMLDNFSIADAKEAVRLVNHKAKVEISGNVSKENIETSIGIKPDFISSGALTKHVQALDLSMRIQQLNWNSQPLCRYWLGMVDEQLHAPLLSLAHVIPLSAPPQSTNGSHRTITERCDNRGGNTVDR